MTRFGTDLRHRYGIFGDKSKRHSRRERRRTAVLAGYHLQELRASLCKNRLLKCWWKMDCPHFFLQNSSNICNERKWPLFPQIRFPYFLTICFFIGKSKTAQNRKLKPKFWLLGDACLKLTHSTKQPDFLRVSR